MLVGDAMNLPTKRESVCVDLSLVPKLTRSKELYQKKYKKDTIYLKYYILHTITINYDFS